MPATPTEIYRATEQLVAAETIYHRFTAATVTIKIGSGYSTTRMIKAAITTKIHSATKNQHRSTMTTIPAQIHCGKNNSTD